MKAFLVPILALALAGCNVTVPTPAVVVPVVNTVTSTITSVVNGAAEVCKFEPAFDFVTKLINSDRTQTAEDWVEAICDAVELRKRSRSSTRSVSVPKVNGIPLQGRYVR